MADNMEPQDLRECLECLWVAFRPTRRRLDQQEQADKADLVFAPLHKVVREVHGPWFRQTSKRFARAELLRRVRKWFFSRLTRYVSLTLLLDYFRRGADK